MTNNTKLSKKTRNKIFCVVAIFIFCCAVFWSCKGTTLQILGLRVLSKVGAVNSYKASMHLGKLYSENGNHRKVIEVLSPLVFSDLDISVLEKDLPKDSILREMKFVQPMDNYLLLAKAYLAIDQKSEAERVLKRGMDFYTYRSPVFVALETMYMDDGRFEDMRQLYASLPKLKDDVALYSYEVGVTYFYEKKFADAIILFDKTVAIEPRFKHPYKPNVYQLGAFSRKIIYGNENCVNYIVKAINNGYLNKEEFLDGNYLNDIKYEVKSRLSG